MRSKNLVIWRNYVKKSNDQANIVFFILYSHEIMSFFFWIIFHIHRNPLWYTQL